MMAVILGLFGRYKLLLEIVVIGALVAFGVVEVHRFLEHERDVGRAEVQGKWDKQIALDKETKAAREKEFAAQLAQATKNGAEREQTIRTLATAAGASSVGLRDTIAAVSASMSAATADALRATNSTYGKLLAACDREQHSMAESADRANSDKQTLIDAWPHDPPKR